MNQLLYTVDITSITIGSALIILGVGIALSFLVASTYWLTHRNVAIRPSVLLSILMLGPIASVVVLVVGNSLAKAVSVGGGIALIRYRNTLSDPKDLLYLFLSMALGMACGVGAIGLAVIAGVLFCMILILILLIRPERLCHKILRLKISVPEDINYVGLFDPVLSSYCRSYRLDRVRTTEYGTLVDLHYSIILNHTEDQKALLDDIRCRNGNLTVSLTEPAEEKMP